MKTKENNKKPKSLAMVIAALMIAIFIIQMIFPTNLGKLLSEIATDAAEITVTKAGGGEEGKSYFTDSLDNIYDLRQWASEKKMRNRSLADSVYSGAKTQLEYTFAIKLIDGSFTSIVLDERGFVHYGAELYSFTGNKDEILDELVAIMESWSEDEEQ